MSETQDLYSDSDLAPLSELFPEMGKDRSFWRGVGDVLSMAGEAIVGGLNFRNTILYGRWHKLI